MDAPWWNPNLRGIRSRVRALRRRYQKETDMTLRQNKREIYKRELAIYKRKINVAKNTCYKNFVSNVLNSGRYYDVSRFVSKERRTVRSMIKTENGELTTTRLTAIKAIMDYHFKADNNNIEQMGYTAHQDYIKITCVEIKYVINSMARNKAPRVDWLPIEIYCGLFKKKQELFADIFNFCLEYGMFPMCWKIAKVILCPKPAKDPDLPDSYRPICLLPVWGKILDKIITNRLDYYLEEKGLLSPLQYGFRKNKSTIKAMQNVVDFVYNSKAENKITAMIVLDIKGAFDSVRWDDLRQCLADIELPEYLKRIIVDFINDRTAICEEYNTSYSRGVPQGSSLGPKLWLLIINEILEETTEYTVQAFADDICVLLRSSAAYLLSESSQPVLRKIWDWANRHRLKFSIHKCEFTIIKNIKRVSRIPPIKMGGNSIKYNKELTYLGVVFDANLSWTPHIVKLKEKVTINTIKLYGISRVTWGVSGALLKSIYLNIIEKQITYGSEIWYNGTVRMVNKLNSIQRIPLLSITK